MFCRISSFRNHKILTGIGLLAVMCFGLLGCQIRGPFRSYKVDFVKPAAGEKVEPGILEIGVAQRDITPDMDKYDPWTDADGDNLYDPKKGDSYTDRNKNGKFDGVWLAGFNNNRPAKGVHDHIWTRAVAFRNNGVTVVLVTVDSIGLFNEENLYVKHMLDPSLNIDHIIISSLHIHEVPDTMGIWSYPVPVFSKDKAYMQLLRQANKEAIEEAVRNLQPADMICAQKMLDPAGFVDDSRDPQVIDKRLSCMRFVKHGTDETLGTLVCWGNHPEALGGNNPLLTADFCHYLREGMEKGVSDPKGVEGFGGICLYFQGCIGGLMTQLHTTVPHRNGVDKYEDDTFDKAQALGENLAIECANLLRSDQTWRQETAKVTIGAKTFYAPMTGMLGWGVTLGLLHPGWYWGKARSEVSVVHIGDVQIVTAPGELYPEIATGGVEAPNGQDIKIDPVETPSLYEQMNGKMEFLVGLANDEIGYMIPKSQWDAKPPHAYNHPKGQYGEENSGGPDVAATYYKEASGLISRVQAAK